MKTRFCFSIFLLLVAVSSLAGSVPTEIKKTVAFVYFTNDPTNSLPDGTGFFVSVAHTNLQFGYFVTAKHVLRPPPRNEWLASVYIRINRLDGASEKVFIPLAVDGASKNVFTNQDPRNEFEISNWRIQRMERAGLLVFSEVSDSSLVRADLHVFRSISQLEGFDFSSVTRIPWKNFSRGTGKRINARTHWKLWRASETQRRGKNSTTDGHRSKRMPEMSGLSRSFALPAEDWGGL